MPYRYCSACGEAFIGAAYMQYCASCYRAKKQDEERCCVDCGAWFTGAAYKTLCAACYRAGKQSELADWQRRAIRAEHELAALQRGEAGLQLAEVRLLLQLCHPDRHDNSPAANAATTLLLSLRARIEAGAA